MSDPIPTTTDGLMIDQQGLGEQILKGMQAAKGGELARDPVGRLVLRHPLIK